MKLWKLKLINYIGIYNGMGINEINIDFSKCKNSITVIKGDNGSGKSTLFKALNPFTDPGSSLIPGVKASKYISYKLNNGNILHIRYTYPVNDRGDRKPTTCSVRLQTSIDEKEINENLNVNDGKATICRLLDIDSGFLTLAQLSSDDRGLADKTPTERKKFINKKISELDAYNDIFDKLTKKSRELKGTVKSLSNKISAIGDIRSIKQNLDIAENNLSNLEENKLSLVAEMSKNKTLYDNIISKYNDPIKMHNELSNQINLLELDRDKIPSFDRSAASNIESAIKSEANVENIQSQIDSISESIRSEVSRKNELYQQISEKQATLDSIGNIELLEKYKNQLQDLYKSHNDYLNRLSNLPKFVLELTEEEYEYAVKAATDLTSLIENIKEKYTYDTIEDSMHSIDEKTEQQYSQSDIDALRKAINHYDEQINIQNMLQEQASAYNEIPKDCPHKTTCPFVMNISKAKKEMKNSFEYSSLISMKEKYEKMLDDNIKGLEKQQILSSCKSDLNMVLSSVKLYMKYLLKFGTEINTTSNYNILRSIMGYSRIIDTDMYNEYKNTFSSLKATERDINIIESKINSLKENDTAISILNNDISRIKGEMKDVDKKISDMDSKIKNLMEEKEWNISNSKSIREANSYMTKYDELQTEINTKKEELSSIDSSYLEAKRYSDRIDELQSKVDSLFSDIKSVKRTIEESKYKTILYNDYTSEYNKYTKEFDKYETIRYYCSPTTGIQTVFMEMYMNSIIGISNQLLSMFFRGEYVLQPFVVNEKEFRMPVLGSGILNDDISSMSTSQICMISMILSFALLHQSSSIYNIIKIDELEGGLDTQNRLNFFTVLSSLMNQLQFEQCIMISHNTELNMNNMDVIILKNTDPDFIREGNIIFDLQEL